MKTTYQIDSAELKLAIEMWMASIGTPVTDADTFTVDGNGNVTIIVSVSHVPVPPVVIVPPIGPIPGHSVIGNSPLSATVRATTFGLDYDTGEDDTGDENNQGKPLTGFFYDPKTNQPYVTHNKILIGASLPRETMLSTFLGVHSWKTDGIDSVWSTHRSMLRQWIDGNKPLLNIDSGGKTIFSVPLVDAGPSANTGNGLDLTYAASKVLGTKGNAMATYEIIVDGKAIPILGWPILA